VTVYLGDDRLVHIVESSQRSLHFLELPCAVIKISTSAAATAGFGMVAVGTEVIPRAKRGTRAAHDDRMHRGVIVGFPQCPLDLVAHLLGDGIVPMRTVERDAGTATLDFVSDVLELRHDNSFLTSLHGEKLANCRLMLGRVECAAFNREAGLEDRVGSIAQ